MTANDLQVWLTHLPWYVKMALALGLGGVAWKAVLKSIPTFFSWATPKAVALTAAGVRFVLNYPIARFLILSNKPEFRAAAKATLDGLEALLEAVEVELDKDLADAVPDQSVPPVAPK